MKIIENALAELRRTLILIKLFNSSIDSILVFIGFTLLFVLIKIPWYYAAIPFLLHAIIYIPRKMKDIRYSEVEKKVPILKEKLRTVADNVGKSNELIDELNKGVYFLLAKGVLERRHRCIRPAIKYGVPYLCVAQRC